MFLIERDALQNETGNEFYKSREIKNASISRCAHLEVRIIFSSTHIRTPRIFKYLTRDKRANFRIYLENILSKGRDD